MNNEKENITVLKGLGGGQWNPSNSNSGTSSSSTTTPTVTVTQTSNTIGTLQDDINNDSTGTLSNLFNTFVQNLAGDVQTNLSNFGNQSTNQIIGLQNVWSILQNCMQGYLANQTYNYPSGYLLTIWTNNVNQLAFSISVDFGLWFNSWANAFYLIESGQQTTNVLVGNTFGNVSANGSSTYTANTILNNNNSTTISNVNAQMGGPNGSGTTVNGLGGFTPVWNPQATSSTTAMQITLNNSAMNNDTAPISNSQAVVGGTSTNAMESIQIANFLSNTFSIFKQKLEQVLYQVFQKYLLSFNDLDNSTRGFGW